MMNVPTELAGKVIDQLRGTPFVLVILIVNVLVLAGFGYTLHEVGDGIARRDAMLEKCMR
jgi:hypothetical protein